MAARQREISRHIVDYKSAKAFFVAELLHFQEAAQRLRQAWEIAESHGIEVVANYASEDNKFLLRGKNFPEPVEYAALPSFDELEAIIASWEA